MLRKKIATFFLEIGHTPLVSLAAFLSLSISLLRKLLPSAARNSLYLSFPHSSSCWLPGRVLLEDVSAEARPVLAGRSPGMK